MMEGASARVQEGITSLINTLDKGELRKMQADMYHCSAACCENPQYSMQDVQHCIDKCSGPVNSAKDYMQNELQNFQSRLQRCAQDCEDKVRDKMGPNTTETDVAGYRKEMEACVIKCADQHIALLPAMLTRMKQVLGKNNPH